MLRIAVVCGLVSGLVVSAAGAANYRVRTGDTLSAIAVRYGTTLTRLERLNGLSPTAPLLAGATIELPPPRSAVRRYLVSPGDTLTAIAERFRTTPAAIARASGIDVARPILVGTTLRVPVAARPVETARLARYRVRAGDTLSGIAIRYGVSLGALIDLNRLDPSAPLIVGTRLALPAGTLAKVPRAFDRSSVRGSIAYWAAHYGVNPHLASALAWMESGFNNTLVSPAGAVGVMQITPDTWNYVEQVLLGGRSVPHDSDGNVRVGVAYLRHLLHVYGGDQQRALAAYYQGARSVQENGFLPGTSQYVDDIIALEKRL